MVNDPRLTVSTAAFQVQMIKTKGKNERIRRG